MLEWISSICNVCNDFCTDLTDLIHILIAICDLWFIARQKITIVIVNYLMAHIHFPDGGRNEICVFDLWN